jgi:rhodanese-related sulfurtransferase
MKKWIIGVGVIVLLVVMYMVWYAYSSPLRISASEAKRQIKSQEIKRIVDVRTDAEVEALGSYPNSLHIPAAQIKARAASTLGQNDSILLYCNSGQRARAAAENLQSMGYSNVHYIAEPYTFLL